jgi:Tfp pilus assembly protein PilO
MESLFESVNKTVRMIRNMPMRTRWHALISICVACVFYGIIVYPASIKLKNLTRESAILKKKVEIQTTLLPLYARLKTVSKLSDMDGLPQTQGKSMSKNEVQDIYAKLSESAQKNRILLVSARPQPNLKMGVANDMPVDIAVKGSFPDFRGFLLGAAALPGFDSISHLEITREDNREKLEARMWIIIE